MLTEDSEKCSVFAGQCLADYANSVLFGVASKNITKLQMVQNILARVNK